MGACERIKESDGDDDDDKSFVGWEKKKIRETRRKSFRAYEFYLIQFR